MKRIVILYFLLIPAMLLLSLSASAEPSEVLSGIFNTLTAADSEYSRMIALSKKELLEFNPECRACEWGSLCHCGICRACGIAALAVRAGTYHGMDPMKGICTPDPIQCRFYKGGYFGRLKKLLEETR